MDCLAVLDIASLGTTVIKWFTDIVWSLEEEPEQDMQTDGRKQKHNTIVVMSHSISGRCGDSFDYTTVYIN